jgi:hypothetical protein
MDIDQRIIELKRRILYTTDEDKLYNLVKRLFLLLFLKRQDNDLDLNNVMEKDNNEHYNIIVPRCITC